MADDPDIIDLAAIRRARARRPATTYTSEDEALGALRCALDVVAEACAALDGYIPQTTAADWAALVEEGVRNRMSRSGGAA